MRGKLKHEQEQRKANARQQKKKFDFNTDQENVVAPDPKEILLRVCPKYKTNNVTCDEYVFSSSFHNKDVTPDISLVL